MKRNLLNDNFNSIINYIRQADHIVSYRELLQFVADYDLFKEFYPNYHIFRDLLLEHNDEILKGLWKPVK